MSQVSLVLINLPIKAPSKNNQDIVDAGKEHNVFIESSTYNQQQINLNIPRDTKVAINTLVAKAQNHIEQVSQEFDALYTSHGKFMGIVQRFINDEVKKADRNVRNVYSAAFAGDEFNEKIFTTRFGKFLSNNYDKEIQGKGERGIQNAQERLDNYKRIFEDINFQHFISATHYMIDIKKYVLDLFSQVEDTIQKTGGKIGKSFIPQADGTFTLSRGEGFVLFVGDNQVKIVDRLDFSAKNLTTGRFQK